jgi:hypothetical protein
MLFQEARSLGSVFNPLPVLVLRGDIALCPVQVEELSMRRIVVLELQEGCRDPLPENRV